MDAERASCKTSSLEVYLVVHLDLSDLALSPLLLSVPFTAAAAAAVAVAAAAAVIFADRSGQRPAQHHIAATNSLRWPLHLRALTP